MALPKVNGGDSGNNKKRASLPSALPIDPAQEKEKKKSALPNDFMSTNVDNDSGFEDDSFESMSFDEQSNDDEHEVEDSEEEVEEFGEEEPEEPKPAPRPKQAERKKPTQQKRGSSSSNKKSSQRKKDNNSTGISYKDDTRDRFIDEDKKKIKPFGREQKDLKGKKKKVAVSKFDERNNVRKKAMVMQVAIFGGMAILIGLGVKNALFPPTTLSADEVEQIVLQQTGEQGFPVDRGKGFVENFMEAFIVVDDDPIREAALAYFYSGESNEGSSGSNVFDYDNQFSQDIAYGPTVYDYYVNTPYSATYTVGVALSTSDNEEGIPVRDEEGNANIQWRFFSVNVYYDWNDDSLGIVSDSPNVIPTQNISPNESIPNLTAPGNEEPNDELTEETRNAVEGFIRNYAQSSPGNTSLIDQYIDEDYAELYEPDSYLSQGLGNQFEVAEGDEEDNISHTAYYFDEEDPNYAEAMVEVRWRDTSVEESDAYYNSTYVMGLRRDEGGSWAITRFEPHHYLPAIEEIMELYPEEY